MVGLMKQKKENYSCQYGFNRQDKTDVTATGNVINYNYLDQIIIVEY